jgi:uncharacterized protein YbbK (DUF523 family)
MKILVSACLLGVPCRYDGHSVENEAVMALAKTHTLVPFCPEIYGGLATPREPAEIRDGHVVTKSGADVTACYEKGAAQALCMVQLLACDCAVVQDRSPSCGYGTIHDGSFTGALTEGDGVTVALLRKNGLRVLPASRVDELTIVCPCPKRCHRHGNCEACRARHEKHHSHVYCER